MISKFRNALLGSMALAAASLVSAAAGAETLVLGGSEAPGSMLDLMAERFANNVNESGTDLTVNYVRGEVLGSAKQVTEQHMQGSVDLMVSRPDWLSPFVSDFQVMLWGFTFDDRDHMQRFLESDIFDGMGDKALDEMGLRILAASVDTPRVLYSKNPVGNIGDVDGMKMRVPQIEAYLRLWESLGTVPTQVAWAEAFLALQSGLVVAAEADPAGAYSQQFHVAAPNVTLTEHLMSSASFTVNDAKFQSLNDAQKAAIVAGAQEATQWLSGEAESRANDVLAKMEAEGATITEVDKSTFIEAARAGVQQMEADGVWPAGLWQQIRDLR